MANFLDDLSSYNAKAALAISNAVAAGDTQKANMMSSLKSTANDTTLSEAVRLNALTALVNLGSLLEIPLPPYFPMSIQYADIQTYDGIHNDLLGIQGGAPNEYYHLTFAERAAIANAASLADITFANLIGVYSDNAGLAGVINAKQAALSAPVGNYFVKIDGTTISYDNSVYLTSSTGLASGSAAGGDLTGNYPNPTVLNSAVISKLLVGWNGSATNVPVTSSDSILTGMQKLNARINDIVANPGGVSSVALSTNAPAIFDGTTAQTGVATVTLGLRNQSQNLFLASSSTTNNTQPTFRAIAVADLPTASGVTPAQYGTTSLIPQITVDAKGRITAITSVSAAAGGQVNTVGFTVPAGNIYSSSVGGTATDPILNFSVQTQAPNTVYAGPASGSTNLAPSFRALVAADIANIAIPQTQVTGLEDTLATFMTNSLANSTMYVGNGSDAAVAGTVSGDLEMEYVDNNGADEASFTIKDGVVTYDKIQDVTSGKVLGRYSTIDGPPQHLTLDSTAFTLNTTSGVIGLQTPNPSLLTTKGDILTRGASAPTRLGIGGDATLFMADSAAATGNKWVAMSGDATIAVSGALTIASGAVTLAKMANMATASFIGRTTAATGVPEILTATQATAILNLFSTTTTTKGLVQGSNGADNTHFLRADNTWQPITGTGTVTQVSVATINGFAGTVNNDTTTPEIEIELDGLTGLLIGNGTAVSAATAGTDYVAPGEVTTSGLTMVTARLLGRTTSSSGAIESISVNSSLSLASTTLGINLGNTNVFTAQQEMTAIKLNGSTSGYVSFTPLATSGTQNYTLPTGTPGGAGQFLTSTTGGALSWASPAGSGTTTNAVEFNNGGSGAASGTTFDGSAARTISYNTIGAQALNANLTGLSGLTYTSGSPLIRMTAAGTFTLDTATYVTGTATQYAVLVGGASNTVASVTGGAAGQVLRYVSGANPAWSTATYPNTTSINRILYSSSNNVVDEIVAPSDATFLRYTTAGGYSWQSAVISLGFGTQGLITNGGTAAAPVLAVSGNSGGVVYFSNATTWASSGTLDQYELVVGGGAGSPPVSLNNGATGSILTSNSTSSSPSWTAATYPTSTSINRILFSSANNVIDEIVAPNTANTFLKWDGTTFTWAAAGGGSTAASLTINNSGTGASSGATFDGSTAVTISSNTILPSFTGNSGLYLRLNASTGLPEWASAGSGSGTVTSGGNKELAYYNSAGTTVQGLAVSPSNGTFILSQTITGGTPANPAWTAVTGSGDVVLATSPSLTTPSLGVATATSINKVVITAPANNATLTIADGKTLTINESLTLSASSSASVAFGAGGTVAYIGTSNSWTAGVKQTFAPNATNAGINVGSLTGEPSSPANGDLVYNSTSNTLRAYINSAWVSLGGGVTTPVSVANGGTGLSSGTQGGIPWFNGTTSMASSALLTASALMIGGGTGAAPSTTTTGTGVLTALGINTGSAGAFVVNGGALGTPSSGALSSCTGLPLTAGVTGTLPIANGGTNVSGTPTNGQLLIGNGTGYTLATLTQGAGMTITNGAGTISIASAASAPVLNQLQAASAANTPINSANFAQEWQWNTLGAGNGFFLSSTSTAAASNTQTLFRVSLSGTNATSTQTTYAAQISNSHAGTASTNVALSLSATSGTTINYALDVLGGIVRMAASTASVPHMVLTPGTAALTGTTDGMLSYATVSNNSSLYLTKLYAASTTLVTKLITLDRNPDFAVGSSSGVIVADTSGTLTKSADLTALGILATYSTYTVTTTATNIFSTVSFTGSTGLPANFFATGKTIIVVVAGQYTSTSGSPTLPLTLAFGTYSQAFTVNLHAAVATASLWEAKIIITCSASGASGALRTMAQSYALDDTANGTPKFSKVLIQTASSFNTASASTISLSASYVSPATTATIDMCQIYYLN